MDNDVTREAEVFCPHCQEAVGLVFSRPIPKQPHITMIPLSERKIENARPE